MNDKEKLRKILRNKRIAISTLRREEASRKILKELYPILVSYKKVLSFASFQSEIDLWPLNHLLCQEQRLLLPKVEGTTLLVHHVKDLHALVPSKMGILEPSNSSDICLLQEIECALIPGLGFDAAHHRLGYGQGHVDRLLAQLTRCVSIGVGFKEQWVEEGLPTQEHDQMLTRIILV